MGHFGTHFGGNYDIEKRKKKIRDELPRRYTQPGIQKKKERSEKYYKNGQMIEAFALLYAIIEQQLIQILKLKLQVDLNVKPWLERELKQEWGYAQLIRVLNEFNILTDAEYQKFNLFQDGRHKAVHELPLPHLYKKISKNNLNNSFNAGIKSYDIANIKIKNIIHDLTNKIDWSKDMDEVLANFQEKLKKRTTIL